MPRSLTLHLQLAWQVSVVADAAAWTFCGQCPHKCQPVGVGLASQGLAKQLTYNKHVRDNSSLGESGCVLYWVGVLCACAKRGPSLVQLQHSPLSCWFMGSEWPIAPAPQVNHKMSNQGSTWIRTSNWIRPIKRGPTMGQFAANTSMSPLIKSLNSKKPGFCNSGVFASGLGAVSWFCRIKARRSHSGRSSEMQRGQTVGRIHLLPWSLQTYLNLARLCLSGAP